MLIHPIKDDLTFLKINTRLCLWCIDVKTITIHHVTSYGLNSDDLNCSHLVADLFLCCAYIFPLNANVCPYVMHDHMVLTLLWGWFRWNEAISAPCCNFYFAWPLVQSHGVSSHQISHTLQAKWSTHPWTSDSHICCDDCEYQPFRHVVSNLNNGI